MQEESTLIGTLVQGGTVSIALVALYIIYKLTSQLSKDNKEMSALHREAIERNTDAWLRNTEALTQLKETIKK